MSFRANSCLAAELPCFVAAIPYTSPEQGISSNILIYHAIKPLRQPKKGKSSAIFENSLLNSLLAGNRGRRKRGKCAEIFNASVKHLSNSERKWNRFSHSRACPDPGLADALTGC
jgi:hypothetical protein